MPIRNKINTTIYESCEDVSTSDIRTIQHDIQSRRNVIHNELHKIAERSRYINSLLPISRLSSESLAEVFSYFATDPFSYTNFDVSIPTPYRWILVTHVCHKWRDAALKSQRLWRIIYLGLPDRVGEFLRRSGQAAIEILPWSSADGASWLSHNNLNPLSEKDSLTSLQFILSHSRRIKHLTLHLPNRILRVAFDVDAIHADDLPALLSISMIHNNYQALPSFPSLCDLPTLKQIDIRGYQLTGHASEFLRASTLSELRLYPSSPPSHFSNSLTVYDLLDVLTHTKQLNILEYVNSNYVGEDTIFDDVHNAVPSFVNLPYLEQLKMHSTLAWVDTFLTQCTFPPSAIIDLNTVHKHIPFTGGESPIDERSVGDPKPIISKLVVYFKRAHL
ncbi:hypothetical protein QCA50_006242 [Cerrena zonata]|uniref:F-box domain-containing protein n=1 Tax=Cerrena zonata TaxID=2478898 RepID=A0AAW0GH90_9APHY